MGMTITEKILAAHTGKTEVIPGELIQADVDLALGNDITAPIAIKEFYKVGAKKVFDKEKVCLVPDHFAPNKDIDSAEQCKMLRDFAREQNLTHYFDVGQMGIEHALLPEKGIVLPGDLVVGADSHTCTYGALGAFSTGVGSTDLAAAMVSGKAWFRVPESIKFILKGPFPKWVGGKDLILKIIGDIGVDGALYQSMEYSCPDPASVPMTDRLVICNMAIEAGAKNGIFPPDEITEEYVKSRASREYKFYASDGDAQYCDEREYDLSDLVPSVAEPPLPENYKPAADLSEVTVDQVVIGSCTNGRIEDMRIAAEILKGRKVHDYVRCIVIPATQWIYLQCVKEGLAEIFVEAGAALSTPTCGPCLGGHMGVLAEGETAIATTNRNFVGRMGHPKSKVYLSNPAVAAASAITGHITDPTTL